VILLLLLLLQLSTGSSERTGGVSIEEVQLSTSGNASRFGSVSLGFECLKWLLGKALGFAVLG
jgi:hypothetical protein